MELWIRFRVRFDIFAEGPLMPWPQFSRWLPEGQEDALVIETGQEKIQLALWFERYGTADQGHIEFDLEHKEADAAIIARQTPLHAGPLYGLLKWGAITENQLIGIRNGSGDPDYRELGKCVYEFLQPRLSAFIETLRTVYGQYWVPSLPSWDSRYCSLGHYFATFLRTMWSSDGGQSWLIFSPDMITVRLELKGGGGKSSEYLLKSDWKGLPDRILDSKHSSTASQLIGRAKYLRDERRYEHSLIDAVSSLEISLSEHVVTRLQGIAKASGKVGPFHRLPLPIRLLALIGTIDIDDASVELALDAIDLRNDVIHEGRLLSDLPEAKMHKLLKALSKIIGKLSQPESIKSPSANVGYVVSDEE